MLTGPMSPGPYRVPAAGFVCRTVYSNTAPRTPYRGPWQYETLARETAYDAAARQMGIDPVELRRRNLLSRDDMPYANPFGMVFDVISPLETFEKGIEILDYDDFRQAAGRCAREGPLHRRGHQQLRRADSRRDGLAWERRAPPSASSRSGEMNVYIAGGSAGNSVETTVVQLAADALGMDIADVRTIQGDTAVTGYGGGTGGSRTGSTIAGAIDETASLCAIGSRPSPPTSSRRRSTTSSSADSRASVRGTPRSA